MNRGWQNLGRPIYEAPSPPAQKTYIVTHQTGQISNVIVEFQNVPVECVEAEKQLDIVDYLVISFSRPLYCWLGFSIDGGFLS